MYSKWTYLSALCAVSLIGTATATAGPLSRPAKPEAREHLDRGNRLYNTRSFEEAIGEFKAGALVEPTPVFDYNLGQSYRQLGKYQDALWHYDRFVTYGQPTGELLSAVNAFMTEMRAQLANRALTMPPTEPAQAGEPAGNIRTPNSSPDLGNDRGSRSGEQGDHPNWLGWSMTSAGVVSMGAAAWLMIRASQLNSDANAELDARARNSLHDRADTRNVIGAIVGIGGVVLTAGGVIEFVLGKPHSPASGADARARLGLSNHGLVVLGSF